jgi:asparagine synthase (glutamine-hydrolysing)
VCGISGIVTTGGTPSPGVVEAQIRMLRHRGPDADGVFTRGRAAIAQNRLAVIDLVSGDPPQTTEDGRIGAVLNGEIYNFRSLRDRLGDRGHRFTSTGDTEVLAHLAEEYEPGELVSVLDGMFALAIWDDERGRLILARDRVGKKPVYHAWAGDDLVFASELKALFCHPAVPREIDGAAIAPYLTFGYVPTPNTFFRGVHSLPPGHVMVLEGGAPPSIEPYWHPPVRGRDGGDTGPVSLTEGARGVRSRLEDAVQRRLVSDVPLGAFLSGGIDSSAVAAVASRRMDRRLSTFTMGFEDTEGFDERRYGRMVARHIGSDHHEYVVRPDAVDLVERLVWHYDQPFGDSSAIPTYCLAAATRQEVTVALSGDGGDELFAGYERFLGGVLASRYGSLPAWLRRGVSAAVETLPLSQPRRPLSRLQRFARVAGQELPDAYLHWVSFVSEADREQLLPGADGTAGYRAIWAQSAGAHPLDRLLDVNLRTYLLDDLLPKMDRMSMAHALEVRSPFLDTALLAYAFALPPKLKVRGLRLKRVLRAAVADLIPAEVLRRGKQGFGVPLDRWFREDLHAYVRGTLGHPKASVRTYLDGDAIDRLLDEHRSGRRNLGSALWTLLTLEVFLRRIDA